MIEFVLAVVGAAFVVGCLGVLALLFRTRKRFHTPHSEDDEDWW